MKIEPFKKTRFEKFDEYVKPISIFYSKIIVWCACILYLSSNEYKILAWLLMFSGIYYSLSEFVRENKQMEKKKNG